MAHARRTETGKLNITVKDGVDVQSQSYGDHKGSYFQGSVPYKDSTFYVYGGKKQYWTLILENTKTGEREEFCFNYEMLIGRTLPANQSEVKLVLNMDGAVSGNHCRIYEMEKRLVIEDLGSKNHTFLNGLIVQQPTEIPQWGLIRAGASEFRVIYMVKG